MCGKIAKRRRIARSNPEFYGVKIPLSKTYYICEKRRAWAGRENKMKRKRKIALCLCILLTSVVLLSGCKETQAETNSVIYYINKEETKVVPVAYERKAKDTEGAITELLAKLDETPDSVEYKRSLAGNVGIPGWTLEERSLRLNFGSEYYEMDSVEEVLCRAAVVRTLIQIDGVDSVSFYVADSPLTDASGTVIGLMTADSFIENPGEQINSIQTTTITFYFANQEGDALVKEVQERHYNSNVPLEKLVMEQLIKGPISKDAQSALPSGTKLVSVSVLDGVCFVTLDNGFLAQDSEIKDEVVLYSIVDSLCELPNINKVQISVNGDTSILFREKYPLSRLYERDLDYLETEEEGTQ